MEEFNLKFHNFVRLFRIDKKGLENIDAFFQLHTDFLPTLAAEYPDGEVPSRYTQLLVFCEKTADAYLEQLEVFETQALYYEKYPEFSIDYYRTAEQKFRSVKSWLETFYGDTIINYNNENQS